MNLKQLFLSGLLVTNFAYNLTLGVSQIKSDAEFKEIVMSGHPSIIAIGGQRNQFLAAIFQELASLQGDNFFPSAQYYYALLGDIPKAASVYNLHGLTVGVFKQGNYLAVIPAPIGMDDLYAKLKKILG